MERSPKLYSQLTDYSNNPNVIQSCINELNNNFTNPLHSNKVTTLIDYSQHQLFNKLVVCMNNKEINEFNEGELASKIAETIFIYINNIIIYSTNENRLFNCKEMLDVLYPILNSIVIENENNLHKFIHLLNAFTMIIRKYIKLTNQEIYITQINNMIALVNTYLHSNSEATLAIINHLFDIIVENDTYKGINQDTLHKIIDTMITVLEVPHKNDFIITQCFSILIFFLNNVNWSVEYYQVRKWIPVLTLFSSLEDQQKNIIYLGQIMEKIVNFTSIANFFINDIVFFDKVDFINKDYDEHRPDKRHTDVYCLFIMYLILMQNNKRYIDTLLEIKVDDFLINVISDEKKINSYVCKNNKAMHYLMYILCTILLYKPSLANDTFYYSIKTFIDDQYIIKLVFKSLITVSYKNSNLFTELFFNEGSNNVEDIFSELLKRYYDQYWMIEFINYIKESDIYPTKMIEQQTMSSYEMDFERNNTNNLLFKFAMQPRNKIITSTEMLYTIKAYVDIEIENIIHLCEGDNEILDKDSIDKFNQFTLFLFTMMMNKELCYESEKSEPICTFLEAISLLSYEDFEKLRKNKIIYNIANQFNSLYLHSNVKTESIIELSSNSAVLECLMKILETKDKELVNLIFPTLICVVDIDEQFKHFVQCNGLSLLIELLCNKEVSYEKNSISSILRDITRKYIVNANHKDIIIENLNQFCFVEMCDNIKNIDISTENMRTNDYYSMIYFFYELCMLLLKEGKKVSCGDINILIEESRIVSYLISQICKAYLKDSSFLILSSKNENDSNIFKQIMLLLIKLSYYDNHIKYLISNEFLNFIEVILTNEEDQNLLFIIQNVCFILINIFNNAQYGKWLLINKNFISMFSKLMRYIENNSKIINNHLLSFYDVFDCIIKIEHTDWDKSHLIYQGFLTTIKTNYISSTEKRTNSKQSSNSDDFNEIMKEKQMQDNLEKKINHSLTLLNQFEVGDFLPKKKEEDNSNDEIPKQRIEWINAINKVKKHLNRNKSKKELTVNLCIESVKKKNRTKSPMPQSQKLYSTHSLIIQINKIIKRVLAKQNEGDFIRLSEYLRTITFLCKHEESFNYIINNSVVSDLVLILNNDYFVQDVQEKTYKLVVRLLRNDKENKIANRIIHDNENLLVLLKEFNKIIVSCTPELTLNLELRINAFSMLTLRLFSQKGFIEENSNYFIVDDIIKATNILRNYKSIVRNLILIIKYMIESKVKNDINNIELQGTITELCTLIFDVLYNKDITKLTQKKEKKENLEIFNILIDIIMIINSSVFFINSYKKENFNHFIESFISLSKTHKVILYKMFPFFTAISKVHQTFWMTIQKQKNEIQNAIISNRSDTSIVTTYIEFFTMLIDKSPNLNYDTFQNSFTVLFTNYGFTKNSDIKIKLLNFVLTIIKKEERNLFFHEKNANYMMILRIMKNDSNINNIDISSIYITILSLLIESDIKKEIIIKNKQHIKKTMKYLLKIVSKYVYLKSPQLSKVISLINSLATDSKDIEILQNAIKTIFDLFPSVYKDQKLLLKLFILIVALALVDEDNLINKGDFIMKEVIKMYDSIKEEEVDKEIINLITQLILDTSTRLQPNDIAKVNYNKVTPLLIEMIQRLISKEAQCSIDNVTNILNSVTNLLKYSTEHMADNIFVINNNRNKNIYLFLYKYLIKINDDSHEISYLENMVVLTQSVILSKEDYPSLSQSQYILFGKYKSNEKLRQLNTLLKMMKQLCDSCDGYKDEFRKEGQMLLPELEKYKKDMKEKIDSTLEFHLQCMIDTLK